MDSGPLEATVEMTNRGVSAGQGDKKGKPEEANVARAVCLTTSNWSSGAIGILVIGQKMQNAEH